MNRKVIRVTIRINGQEQICTSENEYNQLQSTGLRILCNITNGQYSDIRLSLRQDAQAHADPMEHNGRCTKHNTD